MNENPAYVCICGILFVPLRKICARKTEMKNYLELKIPVQRNARWYRELCDAMQGERIPVRWQNGFYHITVAFLHDDNHVKELGDAFSQILSKRQAPSITLDKLEAFATQSGKEIVINLAPSHPSHDLLALVDDIRTVAISSGSQISKDFFIHITLGRIDAQDATLDEVKDVLSTIDFEPFTVSIREAEYRYFRGATINQWTLPF